MDWNPSATASSRSFPIDCRRKLSTTGSSFNSSCFAPGQDWSKCCTTRRTNEHTAGLSFPANFSTLFAKTLTIVFFWPVATLFRLRRIFLPRLGREAGFGLHCASCGGLCGRGGWRNTAGRAFEDELAASSLHSCWPPEPATTYAWMAGLFLANHLQGFGSRSSAHLWGPGCTFSSLGSIPRCAAAWWPLPFLQCLVQLPSQHQGHQSRAEHSWGCGFPLWGEPPWQGDQWAMVFEDAFRVNFVIVFVIVLLSFCVT